MYRTRVRGAKIFAFCHPVYCKQYIKRQFTELKFKLVPSPQLSIMSDWLLSSPSLSMDQNREVTVSCFVFFIRSQILGVGMNRSCSEMEPELGEPMMDTLFQDQAGLKYSTIVNPCGKCCGHTQVRECTTIFHCIIVILFIPVFPKKKTWGAMFMRSQPVVLGTLKKAGQPAFFLAVHLFPGPASGKATCLRTHTKKKASQPHRDLEESPT